MPEIPDPLLACTIGLVGGLLLGLAARIGRFCTLGAIEDALYAGDADRLRMWPLALAVSIAGTFLAAAGGLVDIEGSIYAASQWNPVGSLVGGLLFGYGMAIAGNCGYGALSRLGGGEMRALIIVIVMGSSAYMTLQGPLAPVRAALFPLDAAASGMPATYADAFARAFSIPPLVTALSLSALLAAVALSSPSFRTSRRHVVWSVVVGLAILSGWIGTSWLGGYSFEPIRPGSHSFTAPLGESLLYLMTSDSGGLSFAIGSVAGVLAGSVAAALVEGQFRWEACDDPRELGRQIGGGALMGIGGVIALGCSVGQGLTAFSVLAFSAPVVLLAIFVGAALGLRQLIGGAHAV